MTTPPRWAKALLRALLPYHEISEALEGDLDAGYARRAEHSPPEARRWYWRQVLGVPYRALRREIGKLDDKTTARGSWGGGGWMSGWARDLRVAARSLLRRPAFSAVALTTLALSVGAATLVFSVVDGVLLSPLPYERPHELVTVYTTIEEWRQSDNELLRRVWDAQTMTLAQLESFRSATGPISGISAYGLRRQPMDSGDGSVDEASAIYDDGGVFSVLGVAPLIGRLPGADEIREGATVAVLSHETWLARFGGSSDVLGRSLTFGERSYSVIGVMPADFMFPTSDGSDLWVPIPDEARDFISYYGLARLTPGATVAEATEFFDRVARRWGESDPDQAGRGARAVDHFDTVVSNVRGGIQLLFGTALLVVLVACVNLGNLFLARSAGRREELAVRAALGAGAGALLTPLLAEVILVGAVGGGLGVVMAQASIGPFIEALRASLGSLPRPGEIELNAAVLVFSLGATFLTLVAAAVVPAAVSGPRSVSGSRGSSSRTGASQATRRWQKALLGVQGVLTVILVSAAALLGRSFVAAMAVDVGMQIDRVAVLDVRADRDRYPNLDGLVALQTELMERARQIPGVVSVGVVTSIPGEGGVLLQRVGREDSSGEALSTVLSVIAGPGYFESMGIPIIAGRGLRVGSGASDVPEVVVSESLAVQLLGQADAVGHRILMESSDGAQPLEIVGVVGEIHQLSVFQPPDATLYYPIDGRASRNFYLTLGAGDRPAAAVAPAIDVVASVDPTLIVDQAATLAGVLRDSVSHIRLRMLLMASLAALAALLAMVGISSVVAHFLSEQRRDVGIRMALGAAAGGEVGRVVRHALWPTTLGLAVGTVVAVSASGVMEGFVFGIEPSDPVTYLSVVSCLVGVALVAAWVPARRAASVDPVRVLTPE